MRHRTLLLLLLLLFLPKLKTHPAGQGNTVALKDGTAPKSSPKSPINCTAVAAILAVPATVLQLLLLLVMLASADATAAAAELALQL